MRQQLWANLACRLDERREAFELMREVVVAGLVGGCEVGPDRDWLDLIDPIRGRDRLQRLAALSRAETTHSAVELDVEVYVASKQHCCARRRLNLRGAPDGQLGSRCRRGDDLAVVDRGEQDQRYAKLEPRDQRGLFDGDDGQARGARAHRCLRSLRAAMPVAIGLDHRAKCGAACQLRTQKLHVL